MKQDTREKLLLVARDMVLVNGFNNTGIGQILKTAGVPKGSFYHYFPSKDDLGYALLHESGRAIVAHVDDFLNSHPGPARSTLRAYFETNLQLFDRQFGFCNCLLGNLGQELAGQHEGFRLAVRGYFVAVEERLAQEFERAKREGDLSPSADSQTLAQLLFAGWEGGILRAKIEGSTEHLHHFIRHFFDTLPV